MLFAFTEMTAAEDVNRLVEALRGLVPSRTQVPEDIAAAPAEAERSASARADAARSSQRRIST
jgi:GTP cyclohydrolase III